MDKDTKNFILFENDIRANWEDLYEQSHGVEIPYNKFGVANIMGELWATICIVEYLENIGVDLDEIDEDYDFENDLQDAIDHVVETENWSDFLYFTPEETGEEFGITMFYRFDEKYMNEYLDFKNYIKLNANIKI